MARTSSRRRLGRRNRSERRAAGDDRLPRLAVRFLHARLCRRDDGAAGRRDESSTKQQLRCGLTGNLCRCTGYTPILKRAGKRIRLGTSEWSTLYPSDANALANSVQRRHQPIEVGPNGTVSHMFVASPPDLEAALAVLDEPSRCRRSLPARPTLACGSINRSRFRNEFSI